MASSSPKRACVDYKDSIQVVVGSPGETFHVHKDVITARSPFLRAALAHDFKEAAERKVTLPECSPDTFNAYLGYIYGLHTLCGVDDCDGGDEHFAGLLRLYILADLLGDIRLCNKIIDQVIGKGHHVPGYCTVQLAYDTFPAEHKMRQLGVRLCKDRRSTRWLTSGKDLLPATFVFDFAEEAFDLLNNAWNDMTLMQRSAVRNDDRCDWHEHDDDVTKKECNGSAGER